MLEDDGTGCALGAIVGLLFWLALLLIAWWLW